MIWKKTIYQVTDNDIYIYRYPYHGTKQAESIPAKKSDLPTGSQGSTP